MTPTTNPPGFRCNLCGQSSRPEPEDGLRKEPGCPDYRSSVRTRSVTQVLSFGLFGAHRHAQKPDTEAEQLAGRLRGL